MRIYILIIIVYILDFLPHPFLYTWFAEYSGRSNFSIADIGFMAVVFYFFDFFYALPVFLVLLLIARFFWNTKKFVRFLPALGLFLLGSYAYFPLMDYISMYYQIVWYAIVFFYQLFFATLMLYVSLRVSESDAAEKLTEHL